MVTPSCSLFCSYSYKRLRAWRFWYLRPWSRRRRRPHPDWDPWTWWERWRRQLWGKTRYSSHQKDGDVFVPLVRRILLFNRLLYTTFQQARRCTDGSKLPLGPTSRKILFFGNFQTVTTEKVQKPLISGLVYKQIWPSSKQIQRWRVQPSSCPKRWTLEVRYKTADFRLRVIRALTSPVPEVGGARNSQRVFINDWRMFAPSLKPIAARVQKLCAIKNYFLGKFAKWALFSNLLTYIFGYVTTFHTLSGPKVGWTTKN